MSHDADHDDEHDLGIAHDRQFLLPALPTMSRRSALGLFAASAAGAATLLALPGRASAATATPAATTTPTPGETAGPYPADGSNGPNALPYRSLFRRDIRSSFGGVATGTASGIDLKVALTIVHADTSLPYAGAALYLWHCDSQGRYSLYSPGVTNENYLRGAQVADANGQLRFRTIFPACYSGRWPHMHFEVFPTKSNLLSASNRLLTSQLALPQATCEQVYATDGYPNSATNLSHVSLSTDMVFSDGYAQELATITGVPGKSNFKAALTIAI